MWLLDTALIELIWFDGPEDIGVPYAILSHVWQGDSEQTFQDLSSRTPIGPHSGRPNVSDKIQRCCARALADGYALVWIDTCCIDKTSSAALSEAINSMFAWYAQARVCYAFLHDVPADDAPGAPASAFRRSAWFTRGWTLQELIAPLCVVFLSRDWTPLGTKAALAPLVEEITGIDAGVLTAHRRLGDVSIAQRMSWAAHRRTRRVEDEAYCLMGLFGVNMPTIYGEGTKAFGRLQEEIMRHSADQTLFAWGTVMPQHVLREDLVADTHSAATSLFAPSPAAFAGSARMIPIPTEQFASRTDGFYAIVPNDSQHLPEFTLTSHGVRCRLPVIDGGEYALAVLACHDTPDSCIALVLRRRQHTASTHPRYLVGAYFADEDTNIPGTQRADTAHGLRPRKTLGYRLMRLTHSASHSSSFSVLTQPVTCGRGSAKRIKLAAQHTQVYIAHRPPLDPHPWLRLTEPVRIAFPPWFSTTLASSGFVLSHLANASAAPDSAKIAVPDTWIPDDTSTSLSLTFLHAATEESFTIHLGLCDAAHGLWASVTIAPPGRANRVYAYTLDRHPDPPPASPTSPSPSPSPSRQPLTLNTLLMPTPAKRAPMRKSSMHLDTPLSRSLGPPPRPAPASAARHRTRSPSPLRGARFGCAQYHVGSWQNSARAFGDAKRTVRLAFSRWPRDDTYSLDVTLGGSVYVPRAPAGPGPRTKETARKALALPSDSVVMEEVASEDEDEDDWDEVVYEGALPAIVVHEPQS